MTDEPIPTDARPTIVHAMQTLDFVEWDRLTVSAEGVVSAYGWIVPARADGRQDFALLRVDADGVGSVITSSAFWDPIITIRLNPGGEGTMVCQRVEHVLPEIENAVRL